MEKIKHIKFPVFIFVGALTNSLIVLENAHQIENIDDITIKCDKVYPKDIMIGRSFEKEGVAHFCKDVFDTGKFVQNEVELMKEIFEYQEKGVTILDICNQE